MKCQKCAKPALVHLTEVVTDGDGSGTRRAVEIHLCLAHAVEVGLIAAAPGMVMPAPSQQDEAEAAAPGETDQPQGAIVPAPGPAPGALAVSREAARPDITACPVCGLNWSNFKQSGLMGCPHDYEFFAARLLPLLKRAQEGATEHIGKVPARRKTREGDRQVTTLRLRRELQKAVDAENYEQAARLRDELRSLEKN